MTSPHNHNHSHSHSHSSTIGKGLWMAFILNASFTIFEFIGGYYANSTAIITDAVHDLGDTIAIAAGVVLEKISKRPKNSNYTMGYQRFSILSAIILSFIIISGATIMMYKAIMAFNSPTEVRSEIMFWMSIVGIIVNGIGFLAIKRGNEKQGHNSKAVMFHLLEDVLGWIAVFIGSIIIYFTNWNWIDPLLTLGIGIFIISQAFPNLMSSIKILLQFNTANSNYSDFKSALENIREGYTVEGVYQFTMDGQQQIALLKIRNTSLTMEELKILREKINQIAESFEISELFIDISD